MRSRADPALDTLIAEHFNDTNARHYTSSVDDCIALISHAAPDWGWHVGWAANGATPYATLHRGHEMKEAKGPTVPLALLRVLVRATRNHTRQSNRNSPTSGTNDRRHFQ